MWIVAGIIAVAVVVLAAAWLIWRKRSARATAARKARLDDSVPEVHALDEALRTVESLTDSKGSSLLDQTDRSGRTIRDRLASSEAHLDALRKPDDTSPLLRRVLDEVAGERAATDPTPPADV
ncbi:MAG: hypothetical protein ACRDZZ_07065 [Ilumatobacteraceae bacterium]